MPRRSRNLRTRHLHWVLLGFLCCALIIFGGIVQLVHTHPDGQAVQSDCALCHVAHLVVQPSVPHLSAAHCPCRGKGIDCPAAEYVLNSSLYSPSSPGLRLHRLPTLKQLCLKNQRISGGFSCACLRAAFSRLHWCLYFQRCSGRSRHNRTLAQLAAQLPIRLAQSSQEQPSLSKTRQRVSPHRQRRTAPDGFSFSNLPFNPYHLTATATGFGGVAQDADVRSDCSL